jgi:hypothetical protein
MGTPTNKLTVFHSLPLAASRVQRLGFALEISGNLTITVPRSRKRPDLQLHGLFVRGS